MRLGQNYPGKYENGVFTLKRIPSTCKSLLILDLFEIKKIRAGKSHDHRDIIVFEKLRFQNVFHPHSNAKPVFFVRNVFGKRQFREGLVRTVDLPVEKSCDFKFSFRSVSTEPDIFTRENKVFAPNFWFCIFT